MAVLGMEQNLIASGSKYPQCVYNLTNDDPFTWYHAILKNLSHIVHILSSPRKDEHTLTKFHISI